VSCIEFLRYAPKSCSRPDRGRANKHVSHPNGVQAALPALDRYLRAEKGINRLFARYPLFPPLGSR
jgi:hypothetical protein